MVTKGGVKANGDKMVRSGEGFKNGDFHGDILFEWILIYIIPESWIHLLWEEM